MFDFKIRIIDWLMGGEDYILCARHENCGCVMTNSDEDSNKHLSAILCSAMKEQRQEKVKEIILGAAEQYLKPLEIESKNFIEKIK